MFYELINSLTPEQMKRLKELGVPQPRVSEWKHKKGYPSRRAVAALAEVTGADAMEIEREVMYLELKPEERSLFQKILNVPAGAIAALFLIFGTTMAPEKADANQRLTASPDASHALYIVASLLMWIRGLFRSLPRQAA